MANSSKVNALEFSKFVLQRQKFITYDDLDIIADNLYSLSNAEYDYLTNSLVNENFEINEISEIDEKKRLNINILFDEFNGFKDDFLSDEEIEKRSSLAFTQSFPPEQKYLSLILKLAENQTRPMTKEEIYFATNIPTGASSGKVEPCIKYAYFMGLLNYEIEKSSYSLKLTQLGKVVRKEDASLNENLTKLLLHSMILRKKKGAKLWSSAFLNVFPNFNGSIEKNSLVNSLIKNLKSSSIEDNLSPFNTSYKNEIFSSLGILLPPLDRTKDDKIYQINSLEIDENFVYLYAYIFLEYWQENFSNESQISANDIEKMGFRHIFAWDSTTEFKVLELMEEKKIISINRMFQPFSVRILESQSSVMQKIYSEIL